MRIFLTGTLRPLNTDFFFWLFRPGEVTITARNVYCSAASSLALFQQRSSNSEVSAAEWNLLTGTPNDPASQPVLWHCVCVVQEEEDASTSSVGVEGDIITVSDSACERVLADLSVFFRCADGLHTRIEIDVGPGHDKCICFVAAGQLLEDIRRGSSSSWMKVESGCYHASSVCPALPLHRIVVNPQQQQQQSSPTKPPKVVVVIVDGAGDSHTPGDAASETPLEVACRESQGALSIITRNGISGLMDPFEPGFTCGSDTAHLNLFGFPPSLWYRGRGAFESLGAGMTMKPGYDVAFKSNFATIASTTQDKNEEHSDVVVDIVERRRCDRNFTREGPILCDALDKLQIQVAGHEYTVHVRYATEHRCGVVVSGPGLSDKISGTDPLVDGKTLVKCVPTISSSKKQNNDKNDDSEYAAALHTCNVVEAASNAIRARLEQHEINAERVRDGKPPANVVLLRGAAQTAPNPAFEAVQGLKSFVIAPTCIISGFGRSVGMTVVNDEAIKRGATGDVHSNLMAKAEVASEVFGFSQSASSSSSSSPFDLGVVHVKGCDDAGHDGTPDVKADVLTRAGKMLAHLWSAVVDGTVFVIFADHSTPCVHKDHGCDPVPVSVGVKRSKRDVQKPSLLVHDGVLEYTERECAKGALGRFRGEDLLRIVKEVMLLEL